MQQFPTTQTSTQKPESRVALSILQIMMFATLGFMIGAVYQGKCVIDADMALARESLQRAIAHEAQAQALEDSARELNEATARRYMQPSTQNMRKQVDARQMPSL